jgi:hypothetical protein
MTRAERRREEKRRSKMKYIKNAPLLGRVEDSKAITITIDHVPMTPKLLIGWALRSDLPAKMNTMENQRKVGALLDNLEVPESEEYLEFGDTDWDFIRPLVEMALLNTFQRHAPVVMDELNDRINKGKLEETKALGVPEVSENNKKQGVKV